MTQELLEEEAWNIIKPVCRELDELRKEGHIQFLTGFHNKNDGKEERNIQTIKYILWYSVIDFKGNWYDHVLLIELSYKNSYHSNISMAPFEELYDRRYRSTVWCFLVCESSLIGHKIIYDTLEKVRVIRDRLKQPIVSKV